MGLLLRLSRRRRLAFSTAQAASDAKVTDALMDGAVQKTVTITPSAIQYVEITSTEGAVAAERGPTGGTTVYCNSKIIGLDSGVGVTTASRLITGAETGCTSNLFTSGTRTVSYSGAVGAAVTVEFYNSGYDGLTTSVCIRNCRVNYKLVTVVQRG